MINKQAKILWIAAIVAMGLTTAMNLFGGTGTVCAAFLTKNFPPMWEDLQYHRWLYQRLMIMTILIGMANVWVTYALFRGGKRAYRDALAVLLIGALVAELQVTASLNLRGKAVPANIKFYFNLFTLLYFLILGLPTLRKRVEFSKPGAKSDIFAAAGMTATAVGIAMLTIGIWVGSSHTYESENWINALQPELNIGGVMLTAGGLIILTRALLVLFRRADPVQLEATSEA